MLRLSLPSIEGFDEDRAEFVTIAGGVEVELEYSLYTIARWESKWKKPFLTELKNLGMKEKLDLIQVMCITPDVSPNTWLCLTPEHHKQIWSYISDPMSATTVHVPNDGARRREVVTTELIYYWMASLGIPFECEHWHLNRLLKLIQVAMVKNSPPKKMSKRETMEQYRELNAKRKAMYNTRG